jgi:hypothetical protein
MDDDMKRTHATRNQKKRFDALLALPLERFRTTIARLTPDELAALAARVELLTVKQRWALGGHGLERHRAPLELGLLARRQAEVRREMGRERAARPVQLYLLEQDIVDGELVAPELVDQAA